MAARSEAGRATADAVVAGVTPQAVIAGARLVFDPSGAMVWPEERLLVVADLHLEKGSAFARRGMMLPPYDTAATLTALEAVIARWRPDRVIALGDIPNKSRFIMQVSAEVLNRPIGVVASEECCARGAGIFAAAVAGEYRSAWEAQQAMAAPIRTEYRPDPNTAAVYRDLYQTYQALGAFAQTRAHGA